jgi:GalNAc-alpha-(1->4)-GalNAc-alpha-(1->3)-diNAcBac-PP-undecaprenol alpha-1,4-N-acetyl-D-galactosaminyltransferase
MRITLVNHGLGAGGAERVLAGLANYWAARGDQVSLVTIDNAPSFYPLTSEVQLRQLAARTPASGLARRLFFAARRILRLRRELKERAPDVVVSFQTGTNLSVLLASIGLKRPVIERVDPAALQGGPHVRCLRDTLYRRAAAIVVQCDRYLDALPKRLHRRCITIPNSVPPIQETATQASPAFPQPFIVAMGRLAEQKGFDLLIEAFARLRNKFPQWSLVILGEGATRGELEKLIARHGLQGAIYLPGVVKHPHSILQHAELFVLPSRYEGFPNALCEAMACGLPVVAADCRCGPREIIRDELDGLLVPVGDTYALVKAMERLMLDPALRSRLGAVAPSVVDRFSFAEIISLWDRVLTAAG